MNILEANKKREQLYDKISIWGRNFFILIGIVGGFAMESGIFGFSFIIVGVLLYFIMYVETSDLYKTSRKLSDSDLEGLRKDDLEKLICRIYAIHGYDFNVNDGLFYLPKLMTKFKQLFPGAYHITESELAYYSNKLGCSIEQLVIILEARKFKIKLLNEDEKGDRSKLREELENSCFYHARMTVRIGNFDRNGEYGHEGEYYYYYHDIKKYYWYKPTTSNLDDVFSTMNEIEKYNIEFIKAYEVKCSEIV